MHLDLSFVQGERYGSICVPLHLVRHALLFENAFFFSML